MPACFHRGLNTLKVSMDLHRLNRQRLVEQLKRSNELASNSIVLLKGGDFTTRYCSDHEPLFRQESYFHWTFGVEEPDFLGAIDCKTGESYLFSPETSEDYPIWCGQPKSSDEIKSRYGVDYAFCKKDIKDVLLTLKPQSLLTLRGCNSDSGKFSQEATFEGIEIFKVDNSSLHPIITECRIFKTDMELEVLHYVNRISSMAHKEVMRKIRPGMYEYQCESIFLNYCYYHGGCRHASYTCISASGENGAVLHYGHAGKPNYRQILDGDMCLFDMGAEYCCYASDITCSFPSSGKFSKDQKIIYNAVLEASKAVLRTVKPGVSWVDMHGLAVRVELEQLTKAGLLKGNIEDMVDSRLGSIFMPHGLGHFMGIDTHDVGGYNDKLPPRPKKPGFNCLRTACVLQPRMVITVEPGIYFVDKLLKDAREDESISKFIVWDQIDRFRNFGGVRIEDNIVITENGMELLTCVPRSVEEIETLMAEGRKV